MVNEKMQKGLGLSLWLCASVVNPTTTNHRDTEPQRRSLQRRAAGEACIDVVPPLEFVAFAHLPAEQHDAAVAQRGKVHEAAFEIFELHAERFQLADRTRQFSQRLRVSDTGRNTAAASFRSFGRFLRFIAKLRDSAVRLLNLPDDRFDARKKRIRFLNCEQFHARLMVVRDPDELGRGLKLRRLVLADLSL